jgi:CDP-alcohol phosphatidyltransferase-like enzyme
MRGKAFKPRDVEELIDFYFHRRLAALLVRLLAPSRIIPNQVTVLSGVFAVIAGGVIASAGSRAWQTFLGAAIFLLSIVFDCADGQLARIRGESSLAGRMLDGCVDVVSIAGLMVGQFLWLVANGQGWWLPFVLGWIAGFSIRWHAHTYDHVKNVYLHNTEEPGAERAPPFPTLDEIDAEEHAHRRAGRWFEAWLCRGFRRFTEFQRRGMDGQTGLDRPGMSTPEERQAYRRRFRQYMRLWTFNGIGTVLFVLVLATVIAPLFPSAPLWAWGVVALPMNVFTIFLERWRPRLEGELSRDLSQLRAAV